MMLRQHMVYIPRRWTSSHYYVRKMRAIERLKNNNSSYAENLKQGRFLLLLNRHPFLRPAESENSFSLSAYWISHSELKRKLKLIDIPFNAEHTALLDGFPMQTDSNDLDEQWVPNIAFYLNLQDDKNAKEFFENEFHGKFIDPRLAVIGSYAQGDQGRISKAICLQNWARSYKFCPQCAAPLIMKLSKSSATCSSCKAPFYPPVTPVSICLITNEMNSHLLLVNLPQSRKKTYTAVAGFSEPGETLEETTKREIAEEVGVVVWDIQYLHFSQSWPFPNGSMMCGFMAAADMFPGQVDFDLQELQDAGWFSREQVQEAFNRTARNLTLNLHQEPEDVQNKRLVFIPPPGTLAHKMIHYWLTETV